MPKFTVSLPDGTSATHELVDASITVGRLPDKALQIEDASVSSHHAELTLEEGGDYKLTDIGSTNGTLLNGKELAEGEGQLLQEGIAFLIAAPGQHLFMQRRDLRGRDFTVGGTVAFRFALGRGGSFGGWHNFELPFCPSFLTWIGAAESNTTRWLCQ